MSEDLQFFASGFLGSACVEMTGSLPPEIWDRTERWVGAVQKPNCMGGIKAVEDLWTAHVAGDPGVNSFDFAESVLKAAKAAFGSGSLGDWLRAQMASPFYGEYHQAWLEETVNVALCVFGTGRRQFTYNVWSGLVDTSRRTPCPGPSRLLNEKVLGLASYDQMSMTEFIGRWVAQPRGIHDLLESLHMLYGTRA